jgi:hypothetical protein
MAILVASVITTTPVQAPRRKSLHQEAVGGLRLGLAGHAAFETYSFRRGCQLLLGELPGLRARLLPANFR